MNKMIYAFFVFSIIALMGSPVLYAEGDDSIISEEGAGPTLNDGAGTSAPEVGASGPRGIVDEQEDVGESDPSAFEGDTDSTPGERAPENLPMDDSPVDAGVGI